MSENIGKQENREIVRSPFRADGEKPYIFISYSHRDRERVFPIIKRLYEQGWRIWYDEGLEIATNYLATLAQHIKNCAAFLLFVTENSVTSDFVCEKELIVASNYNKIIVQCVLDETAQFSGEAQDVLDIVTASRKHPKTDKAGLEAALESIEGLTRGEPRVAKEITVATGRPVAVGDEKEYSWEPCDGGVRLMSYWGKDEEVHIPAEYPAVSGQAVVKLGDVFWYNDTVRKVWIPKTVKRIGARLFGWSCHPNDVYIPSGVEDIDSKAIMLVNTENFRIHCAENSEAHRYALEHNFNAVLDESLRVKNANEVPYVYCSYAPDAKSRVDETLEKLAAAGCEVRDSGSANGMQRIGMLNRSRCFIAFITREYITDDYIQELMLASNAGKNLTMYMLEDCALPPELELAHPADQQLRYNELTEKERTAKLVEWLGINGCCRAVSVPDFVSQETGNGIALLKYTGSGGDVVIAREYGGIPVTLIGNSAFVCCSGLRSVAIPDSVTSIGGGIFGACTALRRIDVSENNEHYIAVDGVLYSKDRTVLVAYPNQHSGSYSVPDSVTTIASGAFMGCRGLTSVTIPNSVITIGNWAFVGCIGLTSVTIPDSVNTIGDWAFRNCSNLTSVTIANSVTSIGKRAFMGCRGLTSVTIPDSVTTIGDSAFSGCSGLVSVTIPDSVTRIGDDAFRDCPNLTVSCSKDSCAWAYCDKNTIRHEPPAASELTKHEESAPKATEEITSDTAEVPAVPETPQEKASLSTQRKKSPAHWLVPLLILLALAAAAGLQISGLVDILGLLGL